MYIPQTAYEAIREFFTQPGAELAAANADLGDPDEFADWAEDLRVARELTVSFDAQRLIEEVVRDAAENFDHACPGWAR